VAAAENGAMEAHHHPDRQPRRQLTGIVSEYEEIAMPELRDKCDIAAAATDHGHLDENQIAQKNYLKVIHADEKTKFSARNRKGFMDNIVVRARIVGLERTEAARSLNPFLYTIELRHGGFTWTVTRRYNHFFKLHSLLSMFRKTQTLLHPRQHYHHHHHQDRHHEKVNDAEEDGEAEESAKPVLETQVSAVTSAVSEDEAAFKTAPSSPRVLHRACDQVDSAAANFAPTAAAANSTLSSSSRSSLSQCVPAGNFPKKPDFMLSADDLEHRRTQLENYLNVTLQFDEYRNHPAMLTFLEVSEFSFVNGLIKSKEGMVRKRTGDSPDTKWYHRISSGIKYFLCLMCTRCRWRKIWCIIQETCIVGISPKTGEVSLVLLFDNDFQFSSGKRQTEISRNCMRVTNLTRVFYMRTFDNHRIEEWVKALEGVASGGGSPVHLTPPPPGRLFIQSNPHKSFAPVRESQLAYWFVDGQTFMSSVADVIAQAKEEIFITDWWLSPEVFLKRGNEFSQELRLDRLLKRKAAEGVKVFVLLYKELTFALALDSLYSKRTLSNRNIRVMRHPDRVGGEDLNEFLWAHHEKLVVVDQSYAFVGGIDLCYGRWDNHRHQLTDLPPAPSTRASTSAGSPTSAADALAAAAVTLSPLSAAAALPKDSTDSTGAPTAAVLAATNAGPTQRRSLGLTSNAPATSSRTQRKGDGLIAQALIRGVHETTVSPIIAMTNKTDNDEVVNNNDSELDEEDREGMSKRIKRTFARAKQKFRRSSSLSFNRDSMSSSLSSESDDDAAAADNDNEEEGLRKRIRSAVRNAMSKGRASQQTSVSKDESNFVGSATPLTTHRGVENHSFAKSKEALSVAKLEGLGEQIALKNEDTVDAAAAVAAASSSTSAAAAPGNFNYLWRGKDYVNFIVKDVTRPDLPDADNVDRRTTPRMPWHDIATMIQGESARDVARHFIQRWNAIKTEKAKFHSSYPYLIPKSYQSGLPPPIVLKTAPGANVQSQVLRSACLWSAGIDEKESSIEAAMISAIEESERFIYIENQFFITDSGSCTTAASVKQTRDSWFVLNDCPVTNGIGKALYERIRRAHRGGHKFRVYVVVPLLPAFEGNIGESSAGNAMRVILHYNNSSMHSLLTRLKVDGGVRDPLDYISFCSLRTWNASQMVTPVTELVYVHSKLMIVDDKVVICGSANINDRSLLGDRDSEVCLRIQDTEFDDVTGTKQGRYAGRLRRRLMLEHLGKLPDPPCCDYAHCGNDKSSCDYAEEVGDCTSDSFWKFWNDTAAQNTKCFEQVFLCLPSDNIPSLAACDQHQSKTPMAEIDRYAARQILASTVKGNLVEYPRKFLSQENLLPSVTSKEGIVPFITWT